VRAAEGEEVPAPREGKVVVFRAHFMRGFGLPASGFFRRFLNHYGLQPHHLGANAVLMLSAFATFCEAYLGIWPCLDLWAKLFYLKPQGPEGEMQTCGAVSIYRSPSGCFPKVDIVDSAKKWQRSFFYVKNVQPGVDGIDLPPFTNTVPAEKLNWAMKPRANPDLTKMLARVKELVDTHGLKGTDLLCTFQERRVLPLQRRIHKIGHMSGRLDPSRVSTIELSTEEVARRVNKISVAKLAPDWRWGMEPFSRANMPPKVRSPAALWSRL
jgi:hypothetical protein